MAARTEEEDRLFLEAIELYHREWEKVTNHIGSRTKSQVSSRRLLHSTATAPLQCWNAQRAASRPAAGP